MAINGWNFNQIWSIMFIHICSAVIVISRYKKCFTSDRWNQLVISWQTKRSLIDGPFILSETSFIWVQSYVSNAFNAMLVTVAELALRSAPEAGDSRTQPKPGLRSAPICPSVPGLLAKRATLLSGNEGVTRFPITSDKRLAGLRNPRLLLSAVFETQFLIIYRFYGSFVHLVQLGSKTTQWLLAKNR